MLQTFLKKIFSKGDNKEIKKVLPLIEEIHMWSEKFSHFSAEDFPKKTKEFKERVQKKEETLEAILPEVFGLIESACKVLQGTKFLVGKDETEWQILPYNVQFTGAIILHHGRISEMKTGEGKTFVALMALYLNCLEGKGAHLITVNDYLAKRDAEWMNVLYSFLGVSVGIVIHGLSPEEKREAYACDITYGTNNELGFDYLRDNMAKSVEDQVMQRGVHFAIIDEVDSILIDEARTPLIISAPAEESTEKYKKYSVMIKNLAQDEDYKVDEKIKTAILTEKGITKMEQIMGVENIYTEKGFEEVHHIEQALKANFVFRKDIDYVVKENEIIIVDEFTGRLMPGRRYSDGLHQAIEAKEKVEIKRESKTLATITFQNFFRLYTKLAGMTGTAKTEEEEFAKIYSLSVLEIPTNKEVIRLDKHDVIYKNEEGKTHAIVKRIQEAYEKKQPVLVGTISIEKSEHLSRLLKKEKIPHHVLNAKYHEKEADIIRKAGEKGAITIATNMAGRGTDIKLGESVPDLGGLLVIGTERHESRRIDNQLRGRSGRQGDPGESQFFVSMEDDLMRLFGAEKVKKMMETMGIPDDLPIENVLISRSIENAQKKVEGRNFDTRKHILQYDDVMNKHREIIYTRRQKQLVAASIHVEVMNMIQEEAKYIVQSILQEKESHEWDRNEILQRISSIHQSSELPQKEDLEACDFPEQIETMMCEYLRNEYEKRIEGVPLKVVHHAEKVLILQTMDTLWVEHIDTMTHLRESVSLRGYGQKDPLIEYKQEAYERFLQLLDTIRRESVSTLFKFEIEMTEFIPQTRAPSLTNEDQIINQLRESSMSSSGKKGPIIMEGSSENTVTLIKESSTTSKNISQPKVERNEPCPCGSGKKYKKCCGF